MQQLIIKEKFLYKLVPDFLEPTFEKQLYDVYVWCCTNETKFAPSTPIPIVDVLRDHLEEMFQQSSSYQWYRDPHAYKKMHTNDIEWDTWYADIEECCGEDFHEDISGKLDDWHMVYYAAEKGGFVNMPGVEVW